MIATLFTTQSRKAWIAGLVATVLTPLVEALGHGQLTWQIALMALAEGVISAAAVFLVKNENDPALLPVERAAAKTAIDAAATAGERAGLHAEPLAVVIDDEFEGQTVTGD